jgi:hypothetical protein
MFKNINETNIKENNNLFHSRNLIIRGKIKNVLEFISKNLNIINCINYYIWINLNN